MGPMGPYSAGTTPDNWVRALAHAQCPDGYAMVIRSQEQWEAIANAVNVGIDAHLEAFVRSQFDATTGEVCVHPEEVHVLVRRLWGVFESAEADANVDAACEAYDLRSAILSTLGVEEI